MEIYERIRELRKNYLNMNMETFGDYLGVSRDTINNIEHNRLARPDQKLPLYKLICSKFNVNEDWLLNGNEPKFITPDTFSLDQFAREHGASDLEMEIMKAYFELDPEIRKTVLNHFKGRFSSAAPAVEPIDVEPSTAELEAEYKKSRSNSAQKTESPASNTTNGMDIQNTIDTEKASNQ